MDHYRAFGRKRASCWSRPKGDCRQQANQATRQITRREERAAKADPAADSPHWVDQEVLPDGSGHLRLPFQIRVF